MVGPANEASILLQNTVTNCLLDSGSQVSTVSAEFYNTISPKPLLRSMNDFKLKISGPDGNTLPFLGYIATSVSVPILNVQNVHSFLLVAQTTKYHSSTPVLLGTNVLRRCRQQTMDETNLPEACDIAFMSLRTDVGIAKVKSTSDCNIQLQPFEIKTISGIVCKPRDAETAVTEGCSGVFSGTIGVCPRVVTLNKPGNTARIPVRNFNMSAKVVQIPKKVGLCDLHEVKVLRSVDPFQMDK